ncbi:hypothetical protein ACEWY4_027655 [Coilia grayii]|uniref:Uncharacterized protein n=1 Tax=Coilia grayii TaxID=363190 RepID=A0ABD1IP11_9TELE
MALLPHRGNCCYPPVLVPASCHSLLFLDDTKIKNFVTCFKDQQFLVFFFSRVRRNLIGRYEQHFPYVSLCGRERNFLRCDDQPIVFTQLLPSPPETGALLSYCGGGSGLAVRFRPEALYMRPSSGRLYHPAPGRAGGVGLLRSALAFQLSASFLHAPDGRPTHFLWEGHQHALTNELEELLATDHDHAEGAGTET